MSQVCKSCGGTDHNRVSSQKCLHHKPRRRKRYLETEFLENFEIKHTTIKATLHKYCTNKAVLNKIKADIAEMSTLFVEASIYINYKLHRNWPDGIFPEEPYNFDPFYHDLQHKSKNKYDLDLAYGRLRLTHYSNRFYNKKYRLNLFIARHYHHLAGKHRREIRDANGIEKI